MFPEAAVTDPLHPAQNLGVNEADLHLNKENTEMGLIK
jgi:hypothetical protein